MRKKTQKSNSAEDVTTTGSKKLKDVKKQTSLGDFFKLKISENSNEIKEQEQEGLGDGIFEKDEIFISSWNVNGIRAQLKRNDLENYIKEYQPDIFCINESKIDKSMFEIDNVKEQLKFFKDYKQFWNFCKPPKKGYSGVAVFSKIAPISVQNDLGISKHDSEGRVITVEYDKFYLCSVYVPNAGQGLKRLDYRTKEWDVDFQKHLNNLKEKKDVILTGDLNVAHHEIDLANPKGNLKSAGFTIEERESFTKFLKTGWIDTFRKLNPETVKYSYFSMRTKGREKNSGWRLDYYVVNKKLFPYVISSDINNKIYGSDHTPVELKINLGLEDIKELSDSDSQSSNSQKSEQNSNE